MTDSLDLNFVERIAARRREFLDAESERLSKPPGEAISEGESDDDDDNAKPDGAGTDDGAGLDDGGSL